MGGDLMDTQIKTTDMVEALKLERGAWLIKQVNIEKWGTEIVIHAIHDPFSTQNTGFQMIFRNCQEFSWDTMHKKYDPRAIESDVIGFDVYQREQGQEAVIHTDLFELIIKYDELVIQKDW